VSWSNLKRKTHTYVPLKLVLSGVWHKFMGRY